MDHVPVTTFLNEWHAIGGQSDRPNQLWFKLTARRRNHGGGYQFVLLNPDADALLPGLPKTLTLIITDLTTVQAQQLQRTLIMQTDAPDLVRRLAKTYDRGTRAANRRAEVAYRAARTATLAAETAFARSMLQEMLIS